MSLLCISTCLGLPLLCSSELRTYISSQPGLHGKAVPSRLLLTKEPGLVSATSNNVLKKGPELEDTKKYVKKEENKREDQADTQLEGTRILRKAPLASLKAPITAESPMSRFSSSKLSAASSREKRTDAGS